MRSRQSQTQSLQRGLSWQERRHVGWLRGGLPLEGLLQTGPCLLQRVQGQRQRGLPQRHLVQQGLHHVMWRRWTTHLHQVNLHHMYHC